MFFCSEFSEPLFERLKPCLNSFSGFFDEDIAWPFAFNTDPSETWSPLIREAESWFP